MTKRVYNENVMDKLHLDSKNTLSRSISTQSKRPKLDGSILKSEWEKVEDRDSFSENKWDPKWDKEEDTLLRDAIVRCRLNWVAVAEYLNSNTKKNVKHFIEECKKRWLEVTSKQHKKGPWTTVEDALVSQLVKENGPKKWSSLALQVPGRTGKQCRERWVNHLSPDVNKGDWTIEEEKILLREHDRVGNKWCLIAKSLPGRSENAVKNRWNSFANRGSNRKDGGKSRKKSKKENSSPPGTSSPKATRKWKLPDTPKHPTKVCIRQSLTKSLVVDTSIHSSKSQSEEEKNKKNKEKLTSIRPLSPISCPMILSPLSTSVDLIDFHIPSLTCLWPKSPLHFEGQEWKKGENIFNVFTDDSLVFEAKSNNLHEYQGFKMHLDEMSFLEKIPASVDKKFTSFDDIFSDLEYEYLNF